MPSLSRWSRGIILCSGGKPAAVCGSLSRSVVTSATYEARPFGIRAGCRPRRRKGVSPSDPGRGKSFQIYRDVCTDLFYSERLYPFVEVASIDEAYLDITQSLLFSISLNLARSIKDRIRERV